MAHEPYREIYQRANFTAAARVRFLFTGRPPPPPPPPPRRVIPPPQILITTRATDSSARLKGTAWGGNNNCDKKKLQHQLHSSAAAITIAGDRGRRGATFLSRAPRFEAAGVTELAKGLVEKPRNGDLKCQQQCSLWRRRHEGGGTSESRRALTSTGRRTRGVRRTRFDVATGRQPKALVEFSLFLFLNLPQGGNIKKNKKSSGKEC